jgi:mannose-1-phosphate guanylyltransferase/mannose-6-phosphate isomerase
MQSIVPVILSGGKGTRLWPLSRQSFPKPFVPLADGESLLYKTIMRLESLPFVRDVITVTNQHYYFATRQIYDSTPLALQHHFLLETLARNTAPAIGLAAHYVRSQIEGDPCLLVMPADHLLGDQDQWHDTVIKMVALAHKGLIATCGIQPTRPETAYGYIQYGAAIESGYNVECFVEKPAIELARHYIESGSYVWNSGIFCAKASIWLDAISHCHQTLSQTISNSWDLIKKSQQHPYIIPEKTMESIPDISIDYAVMEHYPHRAMALYHGPWSDVGSWDAMRELTPQNNEGNRGPDNTIWLNSHDNYICSQTKRVYAMLGVDDVMVVDTADALLIMNASHAQSVREVVSILENRNDSSTKEHQTVYRPWGSFTVLEIGERFKIKRIEVRPGASLSLQLHHHRAEHWVVVQGIACVTNGEREITIGVNESTYIPIGVAHRLYNPSEQEPCVMIEVQVGDYVGEDDIVRLADQYGRVEESALTSS